MKLVDQKTNTNYKSFIKACLYQFKPMQNWEQYPYIIYLLFIYNWTGLFLIKMVLL